MDKEGAVPNIDIALKCFEDRQEQFKEWDILIIRQIKRSMRQK